MMDLRKLLSNEASAASCSEESPKAVSCLTSLFNKFLAVQSYGKELSEAYEWLQKFRQSRKDAELHQAWDLYYHVFKRINKQLPQLTVLDLHYVSPALAGAEARSSSLSLTLHLCLRVYQAQHP